MFIHYLLLIRMSRIDINDIKYFYNISSKAGNDNSNKKREIIIDYLINNKDKHLNDYKKQNELLYNQWEKLYVSLFTWLGNNLNYNINDKISCVIRAGRKYSYDFEIKINEKPYNVEFKFNAKSIYDIPQFLSLSTKSYIDSSLFLEGWYDNYLCPLLNKFKIPIPDKNTYLKQVNGAKPKCCINIKKIYDEGNIKNNKKYNGDINSINFCNECKELSKKHIISFIKNNNIFIDELNNKILISQMNKHFMLYKDGIFYYNNPLNEDSLKIIKYDKLENEYKYRCYTKNNKIIDILLRWKNGNGIAYPALQLSYVKQKVDNNNDKNNIDYITEKLKKL